MVMFGNICDEERSVAEILANGVEGAFGLCPGLMTELSYELVRFDDFCLSSEDTGVHFGE